MTRLHVLAVIASLIPLFASATSVNAAPTDSKIALVPHDSFVDVTIDGKPFTTYHFDAGDETKFARPYFFPVLAADGTTQLTSDQLRTAKGDHPHHRSFYVAHGDVNGVDHWAHAKPDKPQPRQRHLGFDKLDGDTIVEKLAWETADRQGVLLNETRTMRFLTYDDGSRGVDLTVALTPAGNDPVTLGDTKEAGLCSVRVAKQISDKGTITNAAGQIGEKATWGKPAAWCDTSGQIDGKPFGVATLDHPSNPRHPTQWHVRAYGLQSANPFGLHDYDKSNAPGTGALKIEPGKTATFRYRVIFHPGDVNAAKIAEKFAAFAKE